MRERKLLSLMREWKIVERDVNGKRHKKWQKEAKKSMNFSLDFHYLFAFISVLVLRYVLLWPFLFRHFSFVQRTYILALFPLFPF